MVHFTTMASAMVFWQLNSSQERHHVVQLQFKELSSKIAVYNFLITVICLCLMYWK
jgi:hypothetical protein